MPHRAVLRRALTVLAVTAALVIGAAASPAVASSPMLATAGGAELATAAALTPEQQVTALINQKRAAAGLPALRVTSNIQHRAWAWAKFLATSGSFTHSTAEWRMRGIGTYGWASSGENLAAGQPSAPSAVNAWMASSGHRANILNRSYAGMGVGYVDGGPYRHYWVIIFAVADPPIPLGKAPTVKGKTSVGSVLTASTSGWPSGTTFTWVWYRNGAAIPGQTAASYRLTAADIGKGIKAKVNAYNARYYPWSLISGATSAVSAQ